MRPTIEEKAILISYIDWCFESVGQDLPSAEDVADELNEFFNYRYGVKSCEEL